MDGFEWRTPKSADEQPPFNCMFIDCDYQDLLKSGKRLSCDNYPKYCTKCKAIDEQFRDHPSFCYKTKTDRFIIYMGFLIKINFQPVMCPDCSEIYRIKIDYKDGQIGVLIRGGNVINWSVVPCEATEAIYYSSVSWFYRTDTHRLFLLRCGEEDQLYVINREITDKYTSNAIYIFKLKDGGLNAGFFTYASGAETTIFVDDKGQIVPYDLLNVLYGTQWPVVFENEYYRATLHKDRGIDYTSLRPPSKITKPAITF